MEQRRIMHSNINGQRSENSNQTDLQAKNVKKHRPSQSERKKSYIMELKILNDQLAIEQEKEKQTKLDL